VTPERWRDVQRVFHEALERPSAERADFLAAEARGDAELQAEVASLLASAGTDEGFLETPARPPEETPRTRIGPYDVVREIGHGGMGTVFLAMRADEQFKKRVAIKVVRRGMDTEAVLRRFRQERQILAGLDHPNIARLLDGGNTDDGLPYLVMEYVEGEPVTVWCDGHGLDAREKIALFRTICAAVHFAHQNLVVHRDLKPGNILVAGGAPKLLDFGVAKLLNPEVSGQTLDLTGASVRVFTPEYASPEQIRGERITTATDVYALGVLLHEILTGLRPTAEPGKTKRILPVDLDTIVGMATRPEPARRYASAEQLSEDLRRYLEGLPVKARRDTFSYRTGKFLRRHKASVGAAALVILSLVGGILATARQARIARAERARADRRLEDVRKLASSFLFEFHDAIRNLPGSTPARELVVRRALEYLGTLAKEGERDPGFQRDLASAYERLGDVQGGAVGSNVGDTAGSLVSYQASLKIRNGLAAQQAESENSVPSTRLLIKISRELEATGRNDDALDSAGRALAMSESLLAADPGTVDYAALRAECFATLAARLTSFNRFDEALAAERRAVAAYEDVLARRPHDPEARAEIAEGHQTLGSLLDEKHDTAAAVVEYRRSLALHEALASADPTNATILSNLASVLGDLSRELRLAGDREPAWPLARRSLAIREALVEKDPKNALFRRSLMTSLNNHGAKLTKDGRVAEAIPHLVRALLIARELAAADPSSSNLQGWVADVYESLGDAFQAAATRHLKLANGGRPCENFRKSIETRERIRKEGKLSAYGEKAFAETRELLRRCEAVPRR
jgi:eukaryotic-like serine/threonine-protein kinase